MTFFVTALGAALAVSSADRLAMADRLFNRGDYAAAQEEYRALAASSGKDVDAADLDYRLVSAASALGDRTAVRDAGAKFLAAHPGDVRADRVRLLAALCGTESEKTAELRRLDRDDTEVSVRAEALYRLGEATGDVSFYTRSIEADPKGPYALYARFARAVRLVEEKDDVRRRKGEEEFLELVYCKDDALASRAMYLLSVQMVRTGRYDSASTLLKRFLKKYPSDAQTKDVVRLLAESELAAGRYASAIAVCTDEADETLLAVKAQASFGLGEADAAKCLAEKYLARYPAGRNHSRIELLLARHAFDRTVSANDPMAILEAARRCADLTKSGEDRLRLAWAFEKAGKTDKADEEYVSIVRDLPGTVSAAEALYRRAMLLLRREKWSAAEVALAEALASGKLEKSRDSSALYWRGIAACRLGHIEEAVGFLKQALEGPLGLDERREARLVLADAAFNAGRREEAIRIYSDLVRAGAVERMSAAKTFAVGRVLSGEEALICARRLIANESAEWRQTGYALMGDVETALGNLTAASEADAKCLAEPCVTEVLSHVSLRHGLYLVRTEQPAEAEKTLKRAVELNAGDAEARASAYLGLAQAAKQRGDTETAKGYATVITTLFEGSNAAKSAEEFLR